MKIDCSNCMTTLDLDLDGGTVTYKRKGEGQGSKRIPPAVIVNDVYTDDDYLMMWESPCCLIGGEAYPDSYEPYEEEVTA
jgi:hypothetical protein